MSAKLTPNLFLISKIIEDNRISIGTDWIKVKTVKSVFDARKISTKKFRDGYGIPIIEYFIAVVREEKAIGNCPIMSKLVNYLLSKGITPREVFDICIGFRGTLIIFLLKQEVVLKNPIPFMQEVATVFDANLSGVLEIFTNLYADAQKKIESAKAQKEKLQQTLKIINFINTKIIIVQNGRIILANKPFLEMLGVEDIKELYLKFYNGFDFLNKIDLFESEYNKSISSWIEKICKNDKPFQSEIYNEKIKKKFNYSGRITSMPGDEVTNQYIITLSNISEHVKDEETLKDNLTHDELTGFRNYPTFERLLGSMIESAKEEKSRIFLAVADIPGLREINELKGQKAGDMAISGVAEDMRFLVGDNIYFARLEGSRFGILLKYPTEQASYDWSVQLFNRMKDRENRKTLSITEVDLSESINKLFLRIYDLVEKSNNCDDNFVFSDFKDIIKYKELPEQREFTNKLSMVKSLEVCLFYMELPISSKVKILSTSDENIKITLSSKQIKIAKTDMPIYFKLEKIGNIKAYIKDIDEERRVAIVDRFRLDKHSPLNRETYRVKADENIKAYITDNSRDYDIKILDMNNEFVAVEIDRKRNFDINSFVFIDMLLPISDIPVSCSTNATVTRVNKVTDGYTMVLLCHFDGENKEVLTNYIAKHQMDIVRNFQI